MAASCFPALFFHVSMSSTELGALLRKLETSRGIEAYYLQGSLEDRAELGHLVQHPRLSSSRASLVDVVSLEYCLSVLPFSSFPRAGRV